MRKRNTVHASFFEYQRDMVRFITTANNLAGDALTMARGEHCVLLTAEDWAAVPAVGRACPLLVHVPQY